MAKIVARTGSRQLKPILLDEKRQSGLLQLLDLFASGWLPPNGDPPTGFGDDFESGWLTCREFSDLFGEVFESEWFLQGGSAGLFSEDFNLAWLLVRQFNSVFTENFENGGW